MKATELTPIRMDLSTSADEDILEMNDGGSNSIFLRWDYQLYQLYLRFTDLPEVPLMQGKYLFMYNIGTNSVDIESLYAQYVNDNKTETNYYVNSTGQSDPNRSVMAYNQSLIFEDLTITMPVSGTDHVWKMNLNLQMDEKSDKSLVRFIALDGFYLTRS